MSYIVFHPGTGTSISADEAIVVNTKNLPDDPDEWEDYIAQNEVPWLGVQDMIEDRIGI